MSKTEPETWKQRTDNCQQKGAGGMVEKKGREWSKNMYE